MKPLLRLILNQIIRVLLRPEIVQNGRRSRWLIGCLSIDTSSRARQAGNLPGGAWPSSQATGSRPTISAVRQLWFAYGRDERLTSNCCP